MKHIGLLLSENEGLAHKVTQRNPKLKLFWAATIAHTLELIENPTVRFIVVDLNTLKKNPITTLRLLKKNNRHNALIIAVSDNDEQKFQYHKQGAHDVFPSDFDFDNFETRVNFLLENEKIVRRTAPKATIGYRIPFFKRLFDIVFSLTAILLLSPLFLLLAFLIRIESRGKVFYFAKRVGSGYKVFNFYKFRSMYRNADRAVDKLKKQNQYSNLKNTPAGSWENKDTDVMLFADSEAITETEHLQKKKNEQENSFFKVANDPRITHVGRFIRNTSLDE